MAVQELLPPKAHDGTVPGILKSLKPLYLIPKDYKKREDWEESLPLRYINEMVENGILAFPDSHADKYITDFGLMSKLKYGGRLEVQWVDSSSSNR